MNAMSGTINGLQDRVSRLVNENSGMENEMRTVQENLRLSTGQNQKIMKELNEYRDRLSSNEQESEVLKRKIQKLLQENAGLGDEVRNAQENIRLSNVQQSKALQELNEYKGRIEQIESENDMIKRKMQNVIQENQHLGDEVRNAQENLRLSANQISKLNTELADYRNRVEVNTEESETYKKRIQKLSMENTSLGDEVRNAQ